MSHMTRKQIYLRDDQERRVKRLAKRRRMSEAALIREAVDDFLVQAGEEDALTRFRRHLQWVKERAKAIPAVERERTWTREELYDG